MGEMTVWEAHDVYLRNGLGDDLVADPMRVARRLAELERERDEAARHRSVLHDAAASHPHMHTMARHEQACAVDSITTLRADLAHARAEVERLRGVVEAARRLRDSGYDGPFIGEPVEEIFTALATLDGAGEGEGRNA